MQPYDNWNPHSPTCSLSSWQLDAIPEELPSWVFPDLESCDHSISDNAAVASHREAHEYPCVQRHGPSSPCGAGDPAIVCRRLTVKAIRKQRQNRQAQQRFRQRQKVSQSLAQKPTITHSCAQLSVLLLYRPESGNWRTRLRKHSLA